MAEGEGGKDGGEDLFEDLDKFFAPIQDVDWPETAEPRGPSVPPELERDAASEPATTSHPPEDTASSEEPIRIEDLEADDEPTGDADRKSVV